jgi:hypothetical protein
VFSAGLKIVVDKNLENTVFEDFLKQGFMNYAYLRQLESYYCILRWIKCIRQVIFHECRALPVGGGRGRPVWAEPWYPLHSVFPFCPSMVWVRVSLAVYIE